MRFVTRYTASLEARIEQLLGERAAERLYFARELARERKRATDAEGRERLLTGRLLERQGVVLDPEREEERPSRRSTAPPDTLASLQERAEAAEESLLKRYAERDVPEGFDYGAALELEMEQMRE